MRTPDGRPRGAGGHAQIGLPKAGGALCLVELHDRAEDPSQDDLLLP
jgi:hypothetical protein